MQYVKIYNQSERQLEKMEANSINSCYDFFFIFC